MKTIATATIIVIFAATSPHSQQRPQGFGAPSVVAAPREPMAIPDLDCDNIQPQPNGKYGTIQIIPVGQNFMGSWQGQEINLCITPAKPCILFRTPTGQRI